MICEQSSTTRLVPKIFISTVSLSAAWKSNVAAEWITTFMLSIRIVLSDVEIPRSSAPTSPAIGINFLKISFGVFSRSVSKIWFKKKVVLRIFEFDVWWDMRTYGIFC